MADINDVRRRNLRKLVNQHEGMNALARRLGLTKGAYISQLLTDPPVRTLSEKTARKWERQLGLTFGWLDIGGDPPAPPPKAVPGLLVDTIKAVLDALNVHGPLSSGEIAELVAMQYADALVIGRVDPEKIRRLVTLLRR